MTTIEFPLNPVIHKFMYDHLNQLLTVYYHSGEIKQFSGVSAEVYNELCESPNPACYISRYLYSTTSTFKAKLAKVRAEHNKRVLLQYNLRGNKK